jgi:hypothetical protein
MTIYQCINCKKNFNKKSHLEEHETNKKCICNTLNTLNSSKLELVSSKNPQKILEYFINNNINNNINKTINDINNNKQYICTYCNKIYSRIDNLKRHTERFCKVKKKDEQKDIEIQKLKEENELLKDFLIKNKDNNYSVMETQNHGVNMNYSNINLKNSCNKTTNNIQNNVQVNISSFGNEDLDKINVKEAMSVFLKSTGGNIIPNMLKHINLNKMYPEFQNVYMTDYARELVKIFDGEHFILKKFKNAKYDIIDKVSKNISDIILKYREGNYKKSAAIDDKININSLSVRLICGEELFVSDSEEEDNKSNKNNKINDKNEEEMCIKKRKALEKRRVKEERQRKYDHLNSKRDGLQKITFEWLKEELCNGKILFK